MTKTESTLEKQSFCLFRIPKEGGRVLWQITQSCNYSCNYCIFFAEQGIVAGELTTPEVFETLNSLKSKKFTHLKYTGGEPFVRKDFIDILAKSAELGFTVDVSTNGSLITAAKARMINEYNLRMMHVSVDGHTQQIHESVRGRDTYHRTLNGIQHLKDNGVYVRIGTVIFKANETHLDQMVQSAASMGADEIIFSFMEPVGRLHGNTTQISSRPIAEVKAELDEIARQSKTIKVSYSFTENASFGEGMCPAVNKFLFIDNVGIVSPCPWVADKHPKYCSKLTLKNASLQEILNSEPIRAYIQELNKNGGQGCPIRTRC